MAARIHVTFTLVFLCLGLCHTEDIQRVGNDIIASNSGANWDGTTFLLNDFALTDGVVFAFSAYFVNENPVHFQIWRPIDMDNREYQLIHEWPFQATVGGQREDVYIHTRQNFECIRIQSTDRLGIYTVISPGAVAYRFQTGSAQVLQHTEQNLTLAPSPGDVIQFDSLAFPYEFSAAAYIDADLSSYPDLSNPSCPTTLMIPYEEETGSTQSPSGGGSGNVGATGATGPSGPVGAEGPMGVIGSTGFTGPSGPAGVPGAGGAAGQNGRDGVQGATGPEGPPGPEGPAGPPGQDSVVASSVSAQYVGCEWCEKLFTPYVIMGFLVWLVIISIVLLIIVVVVACSRSKDSLHYPSNMRWTGSDLWKAYQDQDQLSHKTGGYENGGLDHNGIDQQTTYSYVEEGRTAF